MQHGSCRETIFYFTGERGLNRKGLSALPNTDTLQRPLRDLRISVTDRCNSLCTYCMPKEIFGDDYAFIPKDELLTFEGIERLAKLFASFSVKKIRLTGGEPLLRRDLPELVERLAAIEDIEDIGLTTNALLLKQHGQALYDAGLRRLNVSLDALSQETFGKMNGRRIGSERTLENIGRLLADILKFLYRNRFILVI